MEKEIYKNMSQLDRIEYNQEIQHVYINPSNLILKIMMLGFISCNLIINLYIFSPKGTFEYDFILNKINLITYIMIISMIFTFVFGTFLSYYLENRVNKKYKERYNIKMEAKNDNRP